MKDNYNNILIKGTRPSEGCDNYINIFSYVTTGSDNNYVVII